MPSGRASSPRRLSTGELTEAAVLADVSVVLLVAGWFLPANALFWAVAVVPFAALVVRHRVRALVVGACSGAAVALLALGPILSVQILQAALAGLVCGVSIKRGWGVVRTAAFAIAVAWTSLSALTVLLLGTFSSSRKLTLEQAQLQWTGTKRIASVSLRTADAIAAHTDGRWLLVAAVISMLPVLEGVLIARASRPVFRRMRVGLLASYLAIATTVDLWAGVLAALSAAVAYAVAVRLPRMSARRAVLRTWAAIATASVLLLGSLGRAAFLSALDAQWPRVHGLLVSVEAVVVRRGDALLRWFIATWWIAIPLALVVPIVAIAIVTRAIARPLLARIERAVARPVHRPMPPDGTPGPVPVHLDEVSFAYAGAPRSALHRVSLSIPQRVLVGIVGDNGSGKSTLARVLAGAAPSSGRVHRPGAPALGRAHGTAMIFQRPESQVLGVRAGDDVVWGLPEDTHVDVDALLARVGLPGFADRETSTLSGGELQRLAIAAALAREPALLISDESTAMVDPDGRARIVALFAELAARGVAVVHITHRHEEVRDSALVLALSHGAVTAVGEPRAVLDEARP